MSIASVSEFDLNNPDGQVYDRSRPSRAASFWLRRDIIRNVFEPGQRLKVEHLSRFYDVGHSPIREAILANVSNHLVVHEFQCGYRVAPVSLEEYNDLSDTYRRLVSMALEMAIERGDDAWEEQVVLALHRTRRIPSISPNSDQQLVERWQRAYKYFLDTLISGCGSKTLRSIASEIGDRLERYAFLFGDLSDELSRVTPRINESLVSALIDRDADQLRRVVDESQVTVEGRRETIRARLGAAPLERSA